MARFSGATLLLILVATVSVYTCAILAGAALGRRTLGSSTAATKQPPARDIALRVSVSVSFRGLAEDLAKDLWGGNRMEGRPGSGARGGAGDSAAAAALSSSAAHASHPISQAELDYRQRQVMLGQRAATPGETSRSEDVPATRARPFSRRSNFSGEITEGTRPGGGVVKVGPWGGPGGQSFYFRRGGNGNGGGRGGASAPRLLSVSVYHTDAVHGFSFEYLLAGVRRTAGPPDGYYYAPEGFGPVITAESKMELSWDEHLTAVEGTFGHCTSLPAQVVVTSLTFRTDKGATYGPYGEETGTPFSVPAVNGCIVGFWGRSGFLLDAIGVYITPCQVNEAGY